MTIDRRLVGFGLFLITVGAVMVAVRQGLLAEDVARQAWTLWPLLLVGVGLSLILGGRPGGSIGGLVLAVTFGAIVGGVAATGAFPSGGFCGGRSASGSEFASVGGDLATDADVSITQNCGDLTLGTVAGSTWNVSGRSDEGRAPLVSSDRDSLRVRTPEGGIFDGGGASAWDVVIPRDPALDLDVTVNGGESRLGLSGANLSGLTIDANAGTVDLDLRDIAAIGTVELELNFGSATIRLPARTLSGSLKVNAGSAAICLPQGIGLRIELDSVAASNDFGSHGLIETSGGWETPGFATAEARIELRGDVNAGSLALDPARTCSG